MSFSSATILVLAAVGAAASSIPRYGTLKITTPVAPLTTCTNVTFSWSGGTPPYTMGIYKSDGGLYAQRVLNETSFTWLVNAAGGKEVNLQVYCDNASGYSGPAQIAVVNGSDTSCVRCAGYAGYQYC